MATKRAFVEGGGGKNPRRISSTKRSKADQKKADQFSRDVAGHILSGRVKPPDTSKHAVDEARLRAQAEMNSSGKPGLLDERQGRGGAPKKAKASLASSKKKKGGGGGGGTMRRSMT